MATKPKPHQGTVGDPGPVPSGGSAAKPPQPEKDRDPRQPAPATSPTGLTAVDIAILCGEFPRERTGVKVQSTNKDKTQAMLVLYLQHTDVYNRIEQVDANWASQITELSQVGKDWFSRMRMTIKGVTRENVGDGSEPKGAASDALKRVAMLFGIGRYLYDQDTVWVAYNEQRDKYRTFTIQEFDEALKRKGLPPAATQERAEQKTAGKGGPKGPTPDAAAKPAPVNPTAILPAHLREQLNARLANAYRVYVTKNPTENIEARLADVYRVAKVSELELPDLTTLVQFYEAGNAPAGQAPTAPTPAARKGKPGAVKAPPPPAADLASARNAIIAAANRIGLDWPALESDTLSIYKKTADKLNLGELKNYLGKLEARAAQ